MSDFLHLYRLENDVLSCNDEDYREWFVVARNPDDAIDLFLTNPDTVEDSKGLTLDLIFYHQGNYIVNFNNVDDAGELRLRRFRLVSLADTIERGIY